MVFSNYLDKLVKVKSLRFGLSRDWYTIIVERIIMADRLLDLVHSVLESEHMFLWDVRPHCLHGFRGKLFMEKDLALVYAGR